MTRRVQVWIAGRIDDVISRSAPEYIHKGARLTSSRIFVIRVVLIAGELGIPVVQHHADNGRMIFEKPPA